MRIIDIILVSFRNSFRNKGRTILNALIIGLGIIVFILTNSLSSGIRTVSEKEILNTMPMREINVLTNYNSQDAIQLGYKQIEDIKKIKNIKLVYPEIDSQVGIIEQNNKKGIANVRGMPSQALPKLIKGNVYNDENLNFVIIPNNLYFDKDKINSKEYLGRNLEIEYPSFIQGGQQIMNKINVQVIGVYDSSKKNLPPNTIFLPLDTAIKLKAETQGLTVENFKNIFSFDKLTLVVNDEKNVQQVASKVEHMGFATTYLSKELSSMPGALKILIIIGGLITTIVLVSGAISIGITMIQATKSRVKEIGLMKAIGFLSKDVFFMFFIEAIFIGIIGGLIGISISFVILLFMKKILSMSNTLPYFPLYISSFSIILSLIICLFVSILGSVIPAIKASKVSPSVALRSE